MTETVEFALAFIVGLFLTISYFRRFFIVIEKAIETGQPKITPAFVFYRLALIFVPLVVSFVCGGWLFVNWFLAR